MLRQHVRISNGEIMRIDTVSKTTITPTQRAWEGMANTMRRYAENSVQFKQLLALDREEAVNNSDMSMQAKLEKFHALYDILKTDRRFDYFAHGDTSLFIVMRNAIHHHGDHDLFESWNARIGLNDGFGRLSGAEFLLGSTTPEENRTAVWCDCSGGRRWALSDRPGLRGCNTGLHRSRAAAARLARFDRIHAQRGRWPNLFPVVQRTGAGAATWLQATAAIVTSGHRRNCELARGKIPRRRCAGWGRAPMPQMQHATPSQHAPDHHALDVVGSFVDLRHAHVTVDALPGSRLYSRPRRGSGSRPRRWRQFHVLRKPAAHSSKPAAWPESPRAKHGTAAARSASLATVTGATPSCSQLALSSEIVNRGDLRRFFIVEFTVRQFSGLGVDSEGPSAPFGYDKQLPILVCCGYVACFKLTGKETWPCVPYHI
uniref:Uncharacterized protein n=1 Tax=Tanacetum cinerariifolium TaxID=118510 RepID=A0A699GF25_TANCI|nr:hypothetical protein [Tanacetum cinerariifolium]